MKGVPIVSDSVALVESFGMAYFALGTILDARRDIMVMSLSPRSAGDFLR